MILCKPRKKNHKALGYNRNPSNGFSLVEVLFAVVCISLLFIPVYSIFSHGSYGTVQVRHEVVAQQHAANLLAYLYLFPYEHTNLTPCVDKEFTDLDLEMGAESLDIALEKEYSRRLSIAEFSDGTWPVNYKVIKVSVSWSELEKKQQKLELCGLVFR